MSTNYIDQITDTAGTTHDISEGDSTRIFRATCATAAATAAKVATLQTSDRNFSLTAGVRVAVTFQYGNSATTPTLNVNSTGAKNIVVSSEVNNITTGNGTTFNTWGAYETIIFTYNGSYWKNNSGSGLALYNTYALASSNNYGIATYNTTGLVKPWKSYTASSTGPTAATASTAISVNAITNTASRYYAVEMDKDGRMFVNVPWTNVNSSYITSDSNTTYTLTNALSSHKFTWTFTAGGSGSGSTTTTAELVAGTGISLTDDTTNKKITIASTVTNTDTKVTQAYSTTDNSYPLLMTATAGISSTSSRGATTAILNNQTYVNPSTGTISATYFNGAAAATTAYTTANLKNIVESTTDPGTASDYPTGTVWIKYTA